MIPPLQDLNFGTPPSAIYSQLQGVAISAAPVYSFEYGEAEFSSPANEIVVFTLPRSLTRRRLAVYNESVGDWFVRSTIDFLLNGSVVCSFPNGSMNFEGSTAGPGGQPPSVVGVNLADFFGIPAAGQTTSYLLPINGLSMWFAKSQRFPTGGGGSYQFGNYRRPPWFTFQGQFDQVKYSVQECIGTAQARTLIAVESTQP